MAVVMEKTTIPTFPDGQIHWEQVVRGYAKEHDMSFSQAMRWISERSSLQAAAELMGIKMSASLTYGMRSIEDLHITNGLGKFLDKHGYSVPRLFEQSKGTFQPEVNERQVKAQITLTLQVPMKEIPLPDAINTDDIDFDEFLNAGFTVLTASVSWALRDSEVIIGEGSTEKDVRKYIRKRWKEFCESR